VGLLFASYHHINGVAAAQIVPQIFIRNQQILGNQNRHKACSCLKYIEVMANPLEVVKTSKYLRVTW
jgi:hypothetical protein